LHTTTADALVAVSARAEIPKPKAAPSFVTFFIDISRLPRVRAFRQNEQDHLRVPAPELAGSNRKFPPDDSNCPKYGEAPFASSSPPSDSGFDFNRRTFTLIVSKHGQWAMRYLGSLVAVLFFSATGSAAAGDSIPGEHGAGLKEAAMVSAVSREAFNVRTARLARAALDGQQTDTLTREELVSILVLMSLQQTPSRHPS
jgi:hypothetical protein